MSGATTALVTTTQSAWVSAACNILIDGAREIDTATAEPGETVECRVITPAFGE